MNVHAFRPAPKVKVQSLLTDDVVPACEYCSRPETDPLHPQPTPQVRLYCCDPHEEDGYMLTMDEAIRHYVDFAGYVGRGVEVREYSVHPQSKFLPTFVDFTDWLAERSELLEIDEGWRENMEEATVGSPNVLSAYERLMEVIGESLHYHMAEKVVAKYNVEITRDMQGAMTGWELL